MRKPLEKDPRQDKKAVAKWRKTTLPKLQKAAKQQSRAIFYADDAAFLLNPLFHRIYTPIGETPIMYTWDKSFYHLFACSGISSQGNFIYTLSGAPYTGEKIIAFLKKLLSQVERPITLIWDGASIHRCKAVRTFLGHLPEGRLIPF